MNAHFVREGARAIRYQSATLELAVVRLADWTGAQAAFLALVHELRDMKARLNLEDDFAI